MTDEQIERLNERLDYLEFAVRDQIARLYRLEEHLRIGQQESQPANPPPPPPPPPPVRGSEAGPAISYSPGYIATLLEQRIGGSWFSKIGIVALVLSTGFFVKYAFDRQWIGPGQRVLAGLAAGFVLLFFGERLQLQGYAGIRPGNFRWRCRDTLLVSFRSV